MFTSDGPTTGCDAEGTGANGGTGHEHDEGQTNGPATIYVQTAVDNRNSSWQRTVILIEKRTNPGEDLFIRGGIGHAKRAGKLCPLPPLVQNQRLSKRTLFLLYF